MGDKFYESDVSSCATHLWNLRRLRFPNLPDCEPVITIDVSVMSPPDLTSKEMEGVTAKPAKKPTKKRRR